MAYTWFWQFGLFAFSLVACIVLLVLNFHIANQYNICKDSEFDPWTKTYIHYILGGGLAYSISQFFRVLVAYAGFGGGTFRHPNAVALMMMLTTTHFISTAAFYFDVLSSTCIDPLGVKTSPLQWLDALCTIPQMLFLTSAMDAKRSELPKEDGYIQAIGTAAIISLMCFTTHPLPFPILIFFLFFGAAAMAMALHMQYSYCYDEYSRLQCQLVLSAERSPTEVSPTSRELVDSVVITQRQRNCSVFMIVSLSAFPLLYSIRLAGLMDDNAFLVLTCACSFLSRTLFAQLIGDGVVDRYEAIQTILAEDKKKGDDSKLMFLRYVFHEVRVPLNSVTLGLQLLQDSEHLSDQDRETIFLMREAVGFMSETLNDVLSLQKIEEGMLELEFKPFQPIALVQSVLSNFRAQYDSKKITVSVEVGDRVPRVVLGDQFRLEHVLGNLLSNAIKFSDSETKIIIRISYESKLKFHTTFSVIDQGCGMSEEEQKLLFQPFTQIRPGELQKGKGSGLGLSICKTIVSLHHGSIGCVSKQRQGTDVLSGGSEFFFSIHFDEPEPEVIESISLPEKSSISHFPVNALSLQRNDSDSTEGRHSADRSRTVEFPDMASARAIKSLRRRHRNADADSSAPVTPSGSDYEDRSMSPLPTRTRAISETKVGGAVDFTTRYSPLPGGTGSVIKRTPVTESLDVITESGDGSMTNSPKTPLRAAQQSAQVSPSQPEVDRSRVEESVGPPARPSADKEIVQTVGKSINRVLVCDDVLSNRKMLELILRKKGLQCIQCADGVEVVQLLEERGCDFFDLIFMDSVMPIMCGPEAARRLRSLGCGNLIVGVTGNAMDVDVLDYENCGADLVLTKPLRMDYLNRLLEYCDQHGCFSHHKRFIPEDQRAKKWVLG